MKFRFCFSILLVAGVLTLSGCSAVQPWQHVYLNDPEMQMGGSPGKAFEDYVHGIRTGATVAGSKKASGGCGCN